MVTASELASVAEEMRAWYAAHPEATLSELEAALDARLDAARAAVLTELVAAEQPCQALCPSCGSALSRRGQQRRTLTTRGGEAVTLERGYLTCPGCGDGLFPPG